jgi:hypothetical protein
MFEAAAGGKAYVGARCRLIEAGFAKPYDPAFAHRAELRSPGEMDRRN